MQLNRIRKGFSTIECIVYLIVSAALFVMVTRSIVSTHHHLFLITRQMYDATYYTALMDMIVREIDRAIIQGCQWKRVNSDRLVWNIKNKDYGYGLSNHCLWRYEGYFKEPEGVWLQAKKVKLGKGIIQISFIFNQTILEIYIQTKENSFKRCIALSEKVPFNGE